MHMFETEELISKEIVTQDCEDEFQIRYIRNKDAGWLLLVPENPILFLTAYVSGMT